MALAQINKQGRYFKIESNQTHLKSDFLLMEKKYGDQFVGANFSMPNKNEALSLTKEVDQMVELTQSMNTIAKVNGQWIGYNTDGKGFMKSIQRRKATYRHWTIIGSGGTARSIIAQAAIDGVLHIDVFCHKKDYMQTTSLFLNKIARYTSCTFELFLLEENRLQESVLQSEVVINTLAMGRCPISQSFLFSKESLIVDVNYEPKESKFLSLAKRQGCSIMNGIDMLIFQGVIAFEKWTEQSIEVEPIFNLFSDYLMLND